jgi:quinol-cytochrome oxidoreductase complex cytochrome b subunit
MTLAGVIVLLIWVLIVVAIVIGALWFIDWLAREPTMPANLRTILRIIVIVIAALVVLSWFIGYLPGPPGMGIVPGADID